MAGAEVATVRRKIHELSRCLDPVVIATALFAKEIIDDRCWEEARQTGQPAYDRCLRVLGVLLRKIKSSPAVFEQFCQILEEESVTESTAAELRGINDDCVRRIPVPVLLKLERPSELLFNPIPFLII